MYPLPDLSRLRLGETDRPAPKPVRRRRQRFVKGPIPWAWLCRACQLPGKAGTVGIVLWYWSGLAKSACVRVSYRDAAELGVGRKAVRRGLRALEAAGLVAVERRPGRSPVVTILEAERCAQRCGRDTTR